jgi:competence ComEA-like helix-hairpin-helix protein
MLFTWLKHHWDECLFTGIVVALVCQVFSWLWPTQPVYTLPTTALNSTEASRLYNPTPYKMVSTTAVKKADEPAISLFQLASPPSPVNAHKTLPDKLEVVNVNKASADQLEALPGIGPKLANRIVVFRQTHRITSASDLDQVKGVGPSLLAKLEPYLQF